MNSSNATLTGNNAERGGAIFVTDSILILKNISSVILIDNTASRYGGAIYIGSQSNLTFMKDCNVAFSHNIADDYGGAVYGKMDQTNLEFSASNILFQNNNAGTTGHSVYLNLPQQCNYVCLADSALGIKDQSILVTLSLLLTKLNCIIQISNAMVMTMTQVAIHTI